MTPRTSRKSGRPSLAPNQSNVILILCGGEETEIQYCNGFVGTVSGFRVVVRDGKWKDPLHMVRQAIGMVQDLGLTLGKDQKDTAWVIFDVDATDDDRLRQAKRLADDYHIGLALSNPCIELWFLLHFTYTTAHFPNYSSVEIELQKAGRLPNYKKNKGINQQLQGERHHSAMERAKQLNKYHEGLRRNLYARESNPSTQVFQLVQAIDDRRRG